MTMSFRLKKLYPKTGALP